MSELPPPSSLPHEAPSPGETSSPRDKPFQLWSPAQRGVLIAFILILTSILLMRLACQRMYVSNPPPPRGERFDELASRIDPNIATWQELAVLPAIGEKRAKEIIAYRETFVARQPTAVAFTRTEDLMRIKGIGPAMVETLRPHLAFPAATQPATQRASMPSAATSPSAANHRSPGTYN